MNIFIDNLIDFINNNDNFNLKIVVLIFVYRKFIIYFDFLCELFQILIINKNEKCKMFLQTFFFENIKNIDIYQFCIVVKMQNAKTQKNCR